MNTYAIDVAWKVVLADLGIEMSAVLERAGLPQELFSIPRRRLDTLSFFRFWEAVEALAAEPAFPIQIAASLDTLSFSPPIFAALCSSDLITAVRRIREYKPLIGPMRLVVEVSEREVELAFEWPQGSVEPPASLVAMELLYFVALARLATRERVEPVRVTTPTLIPTGHSYSVYLGTSIQAGQRHTVTFTRADAERPFLTEDALMWRAFEPELQRTLAHLERASSYVAHTRAALLECLPLGESAVESIAQRLMCSKRTLQRRLAEEGTNYQTILRDTRHELALHYVTRTELPAAEIAFLLGFEAPSSFLRAFHSWTAMTPRQFRAKHKERTNSQD